MSRPMPRMVEPTAADVLAAGAVLWRPAAGGVEVALVHRPKYDDWSFPKGKVDPGETLPFTAIREVAEETGQSARLGAILGDVRYAVPEGRKLVRYWAAQAGGGAFVPSSEVDELRWLDPVVAADVLSYEHDVELLARFTDTGPPASVIALVRHAKAGSRAQWDGDDNLRPLSGSGREQVAQLTPLLLLFGADRVITAPPVRCADTVAPLAREVGLSPVVEPLLGETVYQDDPAAGLACLRKHAREPGVTVMCSQGGVIPDLIRNLAADAHLPDVDPDDIPSKKGSVWLLTFDFDGEIRSADYYPRPRG
jgi:8-oxo-dGTP pyrophosphatase MutT (NUDIX family)/phosphohistidine phosphatase SixA